MRLDVSFGLRRTEIEAVSAWKCSIYLSCPLIDIAHREANMVEGRRLGCPEVASLLHD